MIARNWKALTLIGTILFTGASGGTYVYAEYDDITQQVAENTTGRLLQTFQRLSLVKQQRKLSREEFIAWCDAGRRLNIIRTCNG